MTKSNIVVRVNGRVMPKEVFTFSGGEVQVKFLSTLNFGKSSVVIEAFIYDSNGIMELLMVNDALSRFTDIKHKELILPYLPYARQDRVCDQGEALSVKVMANLINSMNFDKVELWNCHSDVGVALIENCVNRELYTLVPPNIVNHLSNDYTTLISPDAGANKKTFELAKSCGGARVIRADKVRCTKTGAITGTEVYTDSLKDNTAIIVDDICDGGMTFIKLAEKLKEKGASHIILYITHGIFSKGVQVLLDSGIDKIYSNNIWPNVEENKNVVEV